MDYNSEILLYQTEGGQSKIDVRLENETVWLSQAQMGELFQKERSVITRHINKVFKEGELEEKSNVQILPISGSDRPVIFYSLGSTIYLVGRRKYDEEWYARIPETLELHYTRFDWIYNNWAHWNNSWKSKFRLWRVEI